MFTTDPGVVEEVQVREHLANCDHNISTWEANCNVHYVFLLIDIGMCHIKAITIEISLIFIGNSLD